MRHAKLDGLLLALLVMARVRIDTLAEAAVLPFRQQDVARHPLLGSLLPTERMELLAQQAFADPLTLLLIVLALAALIAYVILTFAATRPSRTVHRSKLALIWLIIILTVVAPSLKLVLLRQQSGPASYAHDGGVIQTETTIEYFLTGRNPYSEDYLQTPLQEWGQDEFRTALYHYPYLPWTYVFSAPFYLLSQASLGWYDQRLVYLLLFIVTLALATRIVRNRSDRLLLLMTLGLNPIMGSDVIFGQNDSFVLFWIVLSLWLLARRQAAPAGQNTIGYELGSAAAYGLACASKPTAWFFAPFYAILLMSRARAEGEIEEGAQRLGHQLRRLAVRGWPAVLTFLAPVLPYLVWDAPAMIDDVWRWSSGIGEHAYQIWGWGASNLLLALGWVESRFDYWPFWAVQLAICAPLLAFLAWRQWRHRSLASACSSYGLFLLVFLFLSRFLNENYLGYILALLALGVFAVEAQTDLAAHEPSHADHK